MDTTMFDEEITALWVVRFVQALGQTPRILYARLGRPPLYCAIVALISFLMIRATGGWWLAVFAFYGSAAVVALVLWSWLITAFALSLYKQDPDDFMGDFEAEEPALTRTLRTTVNF